MLHFRLCIQNLSLINKILVMKIINQDLVLDGIDKQILDHLVENARNPF